MDLETAIQAFASAGHDLPREATSASHAARKRTSASALRRPRARGTLARHITSRTPMSISATESTARAAGLSARRAAFARLRKVGNEESKVRGRCAD